MAMVGVGSFHPAIGLLLHAPKPPGRERTYICFHGFHSHRKA